MANRVQAPDLGAPEPLRPPGVPGSTFVRPATPVIDNDLDRLSRSLAGFSGSLLGYSQATAQDTDQQARAQAERFIASSTQQELYTAVMDGRAPYAANTAAKGAYDAAIGVNVGQEFRTRMVTDFGPGGSQALLNPDGTPIDVDKLVTDQARGYLERLPPGSVHANARFRGSVEETIAALKGQQQRFMAERNADMRDTTVATGFRSVLQSGELSSLPPEELAQRVRVAYGELQGITKMPWSELDDKLMATLKVSLDQAQASPQAARNAMAILDAPRKDPSTGQDLGPLSQNPKFADDVARLRTAARTVLSKDFEAQAKQSAFKDAFSTFTAQDGSFDNLSDRVVVNPFTGQPLKVSADEIKDGATGLFLTQSKARVAQQFRGQPPDAAARELFLTQAPAFINNARVQPEWRDTLQGAVKAAGNTTALTDPAMSDRLKSAANLYMSIRTWSPAYLDKLVDRETREFFDNYATFRTMGQGDDIALRNAAVANEPENRNDPGVMAKIQEIEQKAQGLDFTWGWGGQPSNWHEAKGIIVRRAGALAKAQGVSVKDAVDAAQKNLQEETPFLNGRAIFNRSPVFTKDKVPVFERLVEGTFEQNKDQLRDVMGIASAKEISVAFTGGKYQLVRSSDGMPLIIGVTDPSGARRGSGLFFTDQDVRSWEKQVEKEKVQGIMKDREKPAPNTQEQPWAPWWMQ